MTDTAVTLVIPARSEYLILARLALSGIARGVPIGDEVLADLKLAVTEACGNAVSHAYPDGTGVVEVRYVVSGDTISIQVRDRGTRETPEVPPELPQLATGGPHESGMGLAIIQAVVDELAVNPREDGAGTVVRMTKRLA